MRGPCACSSSSRLPARAGLALAVLLPPPCPATGTPPPWKGLHRSRVEGPSSLQHLTSSGVRERWSGLHNVVVRYLRHVVPNKVETS
ncbi:hypothetical protein PF002_g25639 [Phytophthora fragariae]|uniref:RxLR effector protein n=1 Tax=Phytophthora fragariae TaxID=53985 RepID=A0A6A3QD22_9STRA|nr:hypothetical protein PF007_g25644 [Phytophthora fragariae]KAE9092680.1 hypothetical protein PF006_g24633 [Phytophthora fragariae]KAE9187269.1 hypothetical protein PF002_g25639 [Phytophthora fragariae]KAE9279104.1 hypothetical protein PF001_g24870 [Phytophthora fragariae]